MIINHNISALLTSNALKRNDKTSQGLLEKISSGLRINRAADDAAGLAISEKMRSQIRGLKQAELNVQDGISLLQTAEGALAQSHEVLQRMRELSTKAASDSLTSGDRLEIQKEIEQCKTQLDKIALDTEFNNKKLLDGTASVLASSSDSRVKLNVEGSLLYRDQFGDINSSEGNYHLNIKSTPGTAQVQGTNILSSKNDSLSEDVDINSINGEYSGINDFKSRGLMEGSYRISTRETPFGGVTYIDESGSETADPVNDLGFNTVSTSSIPDIMPYGEYDIDIADELPFMAKFSNFEDPAVPDLITGVNPSGRNDIDVAVDITSGSGASNAQSAELWNDISGPGTAAIGTKADYDINMYTHFQVVNTDTRDLLTSNVDAVSYYRSEAGSTVDLNLNYLAQAGEQVVAHTTCITEAGAQITLRDHDDPTKTITVAVGGMTVDEAAAALENAINGLDGGSYAGADFVAVDLGAGQHRIEINNNSGFTLDIVDNAGNAAAELGITSPVGGLPDTDTINGTARDMNREITFNVGGQNLTDIATTMDTALAGYNIDVTAVDTGGGLSRLQFTNNGVPRHIFTIDNDVPASLESELNIGGITLNPGGGTALSQRVYNNHTITVDLGDRHSDGIVTRLNTAIQTALSLDDLAANNGLTPFVNHDNGDGTRSIWVNNNGATNTLYNIRIADNINTSAAELGLDTHLVSRGGTDHSGTGVDFNRSLGTVAAGSNIEDCLTTIQAWGFSNSSDWTNAANTPAYDGSHHTGQFTVNNTESGPQRREVVFLDSAGKDQLFGAGGDLSLVAGNTIDTQVWQARDRVQVRTSYTGVGNDGTFYALQSRDDWWWEGDAGTANPLCGIAELPFNSIAIPDSDNSNTELAGSWCVFTSARAGAGHDQINIETIDGATGGTFVTSGGLRFNDGVLDNNTAVLMPQMIRTGAGVFAVVNHDIDFGSISTQANAVVYSERYGAGSFNHYAHAAYGDDTTYFFAQGGDPGDYLQSVEVWPQEDDNVSLLFTVLNPPTVEVEGKGYNRDGSANDFGPLLVDLTGGPISIGCVQFDDLTVGGNLCANDKFVINVAARAGGGYHSDPPVHSDANVAVSGNPWTTGGAAMEYRFDEGSENGQDLNLLGYFVHPLNGGDATTGVWTGSLVLQGIDAGGFAAGIGMGSSNVHMEINYNGTTDHRASALLTGYYFQDMQKGEALANFLSEIEYAVGENQNGAVMFEVLENKGGQFVLRGQAHIYDQNGNYRYEYDDYILLSQNNENISLFNDSGGDGLSFSQFNFTDISRFSTGDRFSLSLSASGEPANSDVDEIYLFSSADRRDIYPHNWRFNDGVLDNSDTEIRTYQVNYDNGDVHEGVMEFTFADFHGGTAQGQINNRMTPQVVDDTVLFQSVQHQGIETAPAHHYTKLKDIAQFWTPDGRFLLDPPQEIILHNGSQKAAVMLYGEDEIVDVLDRINQAIYLNLDQGALLDEDEKFKFVSFVDSSSINSSLEKMDGSLVIRTAIAGSKGEISLSASEPLLNALGISVLRYASENELEVEIRDSVNGKLLNSFIAESDTNIKGAIQGNIGLRVDSSLGVSVDYNEGQEDFDWQGEENIQVTVQLVDNATVLQMGANEGQTEWLELMDASSLALGVDTVSLITRSHATKALSQLDTAINKISSQRSVLGALQNRLEHTMNNLSLANENLTVSESRIRDTDIGKTMSAYVKQDIINQASTAMLAQANQKPQMVLKLLGK